MINRCLIAMTECGVMGEGDSDGVTGLRCGRYTGWEFFQACVTDD